MLDAMMRGEHAVGISGAAPIEAEVKRWAVRDGRDADRPPIAVAYVALTRIAYPMGASFSAGPIGSERARLAVVRQYPLTIARRLARAPWNADRRRALPVGGG